MTSAVTEADAARLLGHDFAQPALLTEALTHPSALPGAQKGPAQKGSAQKGLSQKSRQRVRRAAVPRHYERLEFLGDRVLGLVVADLLWHRFDAEPEGPLTRRHAQLVRRETLAAVAAEIGLDRLIRLSPAEAASGAARNPAILADVLEAVIAAIYLDGGFDAAFAFVERWWGPRLADMERPPRDPKTLLQEWAQGRGLPLPEYRLVGTSGPDHALRFAIAVHVAGHDEASATASSKRAAETAAAAALLERLSDKSKKQPSD
ncbi:MAG: ribonuclease III [Alphaproteobacteria bacterium]